jgi:tetratricopeptide (TPR) repeat protein
VNSARIRGDFETVRRHVKPLEVLTRDPIGKNLAEARWLLGTALIDLEEWDLADAALLDAIREYRRIGKRFEVRRARVTRIMLMRARGVAPKRYLTAARRVFACFAEEDRLREPILVIGCRLNLLLYMVEAGEIRQAEELRRATPRYDKAPLEARRIGGAAVVDFSMGRVRGAERGFRAAVLRFENMEMAYDAALFLLRLADLYLAIGRFYEGEECLRRALELFDRSGGTAKNRPSRRG